VSAMGTSVLTRNRNILLRATLPLAVGLGAANYVLPETSRNVGQLVWRWEQKWPVVAETHAKTQERVSRFVTTGIEHSRMSGQMVAQKVTDVREGLEAWVRKGR
jgi:MICOS complex subunit MIC26